MKPISITPEWVGKGPFDKVCIAIVDDCLEHHRKPSGIILAHLAKRLIQTEVAPGGPYYNSEKVIDPATNLAIGYLFAYLRLPLPGLTHYIAKLRHQSPHVFSAPLLKKYDEFSVSNTSLPPYLVRSRIIYEQAHAELCLFDQPLRDSALSFLNRIRHADKNEEIALLSTFFSTSLISSPPSPLTTLGQANIYCWIAYTIYDHLLDGESITSQLPVANATMRLAISHYQSLFSSYHPFLKKIQATFTAMDTANAWEMHYAKLKREGETVTISSLPLYHQHTILARRSFGHALGPLALCHLAGYHREQINSIEKAFRHYLIARQLSDDLLDWQEDLSSGQCSTVVASLLRTAKILPGSYMTSTLISQLRPYFWNHTIQSTTLLIERHTNQAKTAFLKSQLLREDGELFTLLTRLTDDTTHSLESYQQANDFSATYKKLSSSNVH